MNELDDLLPAALHELADEAPHDPNLAAHVRRRSASRAGSSPARGRA